MQDASEVIRREPKQAEAYLVRAKAGKMLGHIPQVLNDYTAAIRLRPTADAHYALGHDVRGRQYLNTCYQKDPNPQTRGYYEAEVRKVLFARQARKGGSGGGSAPGEREKTVVDREREHQRRVYESVRNSGFEARAEACRTDSTKC